MKGGKLLLLFLQFFIAANLFGQSPLPTQTSTIFSGSGNCEQCHAPGGANPNAMLDLQGNDISPITLWRSTMMGNAAYDPLWQAKVTAEVTAHPFLQDFIEDKCTTCHSPMGRTEAIANGADYYSLAEMQNDTLAMDGVSCAACHQIKADNMGSGESYSGHYIIENDRLIYGPFDNQFVNPMINNVNYTPVYGEQTKQSELCATCHTLFTPTLDNDGNTVGEIAEQTPYLEWKNSVFPAQGTECQSCHMPYVDEAVVISNMPPWLSARSPYAKHYFVGGNVFMLRILRDNIATLGLTASSANFDSTIARTEYQLRNETAKLNVVYDWLSDTSLEVKVAVKNLSGHKFPSGYPSRRTWLNLTLKEENGPNVFSSGDWDNATGEISGETSPYEPHYDIITQQDQVQIYQALMYDVDGNVTYTLLRGVDYIKDNRLPPQGFTSSHPSYDSTKIQGEALNDPNFNKSPLNEGTGVDTVTYLINGLDSGTSYDLKVKMMYQTVTPQFIEDLFQYDTPEVNTFEALYQNADKSPALIDSVLIAVAPVPVELSNFTANKTEDGILLKWSTSTETNNKGFQVERKMENGNSVWENIGFVNGNGTTTNVSEYSFMDNEPLHGKSFYRLKQIDFDGSFKIYGPVEVTNEIISDYKLSQNYPNPFGKNAGSGAAATTIDYNIAEPGHVSLIVYDALGNEVAVLVNENQSRGSYQVVFDSERTKTPLVSGIYFMTLRVNDFMTTKKIVLIK